LLYIFLLSSFSFSLLLLQVIKDIFRKYPNRYESIIATLCESLEELDEPEAKASMIWIIGEYAERIENADELLDSFLDTFQEETSQVQLQLLTATVKLFLKSPENSKEMMESVLAMATEESDNPDLRDRGFVYWRLLSTDPEAARQVVLAEKPVIDGDTCDIESTLLEELISNISTLASVYHKPPDAFAPRKTGQKKSGGDDDSDSDSDGSDSDDYEDSDSDSDSDDSDEDEGETKKKSKKSSKSNAAAPAAPQSSMEDLLGLGGLDLGGGGGGGGSSSSAAPTSSGGGGLDDIFGMGSSSDSSSSSSGSSTSSTRPIIIASDANAGIEMRGTFSKNSSNDQVTLDVEVTNLDGNVHPGTFMFQFKKNLFALAPGVNGLQCGPIQPGASASGSLEVTIQKKQYQPTNEAPLFIAVAVMNPARPKGSNVSYGKVALGLECVLSSTKGQVPKKDYIGKWKSLSGDQEMNGKVTELCTMEADSITQNLKSKNIFWVATRQENGATRMYLSARVMAPSKEVLVEVTLPPAASGINGAKLCVKTEHIPVMSLVAGLVKKTLQGR